MCGSATLVFREWRGLKRWIEAKIACPSKFCVPVKNCVPVKFGFISDDFCVDV